MAGSPWDQYAQASTEAGPWAQYTGASPETAPAKKGFWSQVLEGTAKALKTRPEQVSGSLLDKGGLKIREQTEEEKKLPPTTAARRAQFWTGLGQGAVADPIMAGAQLLGANQAVQDYNKGYEGFREQLGGQGFDAPRLIGNIVSPVAVKGSGAINKGFQAWGKKPGLFKQGATQGAFAGLTQPVLNDPNAPIDPETGLPEEKNLLNEKMAQLGIGTLTGGTLNKLIGRGGQSAFQNPQNLPATTAQLAKQQPTPQLSQVEQYRQMFPDADLTWGQALGPRWNQLEQRLTSVPFIGDIISRAREKALHSQNVSMMNKALEPAGISLDKGAKAGRNMFDEAYRKLSDKYDDILDKTSLHNPDQLRAKIYGTLDNGQYNPGVISDDYAKLSEKGKETFDRLIETGLFKRFGKDPSGTHSVRMTGRQFKSHEEGLKNTIDDYLNGVGEDRTIGRMLKNALDETYQSLEGTTPEVTKQLKGLNKSYAQYKTLETASTASAGSGGVFNPLQTIKASTKGHRGAVARGKGLLQPEAELSQDVLGRTVPDSGTAGRLMSANPFTQLVGGALSVPLDLFYSPKATTFLTQGGKKLGRKLEGTRLGGALADQAGRITPAASRWATGQSPTEPEGHRRGGSVSKRDAYWGLGYDAFNEDEIEEHIQDFLNRHYDSGGLVAKGEGRNKEALQAMKSFYDQLPNMVESLGRGVVTGIPGAFGDVNDLIVNHIGSAFPNAKKPYTTQELLAKLPRTTGTHEGASTLEDVGTFLSPALGKLSQPVSKAINFLGDKAVQGITRNPLATSSKVLEEAGQLSPLSRIFIGPKSAKWNKQAEEAFLAGEKAGESPGALWRQHGVGRDPAGHLKAEIDDTAALLNAKKLKSTGDVPAREVIEHPELYANYPSLGDVKMGLMRGQGTAGRAYSISKPGGITEPHIDVNRALYKKYYPTTGQEKMTGTGLHEMQHLIQRLEGVPTGGSPGVEGRQMMQKYGRKMFGNSDITPSDASTEAYKRLLGEAEARLVQRRAKLTPDERRLNYPFMEAPLGYDRPVEQLITGGYREFPEMASYPALLKKKRGGRLK